MPNATGFAALALWLLAAVVFTGVGGLRLWPFPFPQAVLVSLTLSLVLVYGISDGFRRRIDRSPTRWLVALHISRFVGAYFLVLYERGELPYRFAVLGGWGDIAVASGALALVVAGRERLAAADSAVRIWNVVGLLDMLFVVSTAARSGLAAPESMAPLLQLPLGLLPTFLVPLILFTHLVLLIRGAERSTRDRRAR